MSQKSKLDPRAERSRQWMTTALMDLIKEKDYDKITVKDITDRAGLSRPTFYLHYRTKDEILVDYLDAHFDAIMETFYRQREKVAVQEPGILAMTHLFEVVERHREVFIIVVQVGAETLLMQRMFARNYDYLQDLAYRCGQIVNADVLTLSAQYMAGAFVALILQWIQMDNHATPHQMGVFFNRTSRSFLRTAICNAELNDIFED